VFSRDWLLLASLGIYGVLACLTGQRVPEIGLRTSLGATAGSVSRMVLRQSMGMILLGAAVGLAAAIAAGRLLLHLVRGMRPTEPSTFAIVIVVLMGAALFAGYLPARRASRVDPVSALPEE
jgi:ABC-type antimicrobial peptide transport system permease subunit